MSGNIFDWDDKEEKEPEKPAALIPYEPQRQSEPFSYNSDPFGRPPAGDVSAAPGQHTDDAPAPFGDRREAVDETPVPFEYTSTPFQPYSALGGAQPAQRSNESGSYEYQNETGEYERDPFAYEANTFVPMPPPLEYQAPSAEETAKGSGLAFSAGIVFFSSVVFMLFLGWIADLLIGSSPWGLVGGIVLGSIIGLIQFVRITSRIFNTKQSEAAIHPLMPPDDEHHL